MLMIAANNFHVVILINAGLARIPTGEGLLAPRSAVHGGPHLDGSKIQWPPWKAQAQHLLFTLRVASAISLLLHCIDTLTTPYSHFRTYFPFFHSATHGVYSWISQARVLSCNHRA